MNLRQQSSTSYPTTFFMVDSSDHITGKTGLTPTVTISKNGAGFGAAAGAVSEIGNGWYALAGNATDRGTVGDLLIHATGVGADPADERCVIVPWDPFATALSVNMAQISGDATAADNLETMLDGTGGQTLSLGALNVVANASTPAVTISNAGTGNAVKLQSQSGHTLYLKQVADANNSGIQIESAGTGMWIVASNDNGIEITTDGANAIGLMINSYKQALVLASEIGETIRISTNVNNKPAVYVRHYGANPGPAVKLESTVSAGLEVLGTTPAPDILLSGTGNLTAILSGLGANAITAAAIADDAGTEIAGAVWDMARSGHGTTGTFGATSEWAGGAGTGTGTYTDTVTDGADPIDNVLVQLSTDAAGTNMVYRTYTAANGSFTLRPDPGTYYVWFELAGYSFTQGAQVVVT